MDDDCTVDSEDDIAVEVAGVVEISTDDADVAKLSDDGVPEDVWADEAFTDE